MVQLWRLLTNPAVPDYYPQTQPQPLQVEMLCRACAHSFPYKVERLYFDVAAARRYQDQERATMAADEVTIPEPVTCPHCGVVDQFAIVASAYVPVGAALLRARFGTYHPDEPIQFINLTAKPTNSSPPRRRPKRRLPS